MAVKTKPGGINGEVLHQVAAQRLRALIVEGGIAPGEKLNERELAERLQVSRTPLREALKLLTAEGLVEHLPNRGATAAQLSVDDVTHAFEVMAALEGLSGELACARITDAEIAELQALNYEMRAHHARRDLSAYYRLNARIHQAINRAARNPVLSEMYERLNARLQALRFSSNFDNDKWDAAVRDHDAMIEALLARDGARLRSILMSHMQHKLDVVLLHLARTATKNAPDSRSHRAPASAATAAVDKAIDTAPGARGTLARTASRSTLPRPRGRAASRRP